VDHPSQVALMGRASRQLAEEVFDVRLVDQIILKAMDLNVPSPETIHPASCPQPAVA